MTPFDCDACGRVTRYDELPDPEVSGIPRIAFVANDPFSDPPLRLYLICKCGEKAYAREMKKLLRRTQVLRSAGNLPHETEIYGWEEIQFKDLKKGDVFRLYDMTKEGKEKPDIVNEDGNHQVCVSLSDAKSLDGEEENYSVESLALRGF
jgi:hypothetical protein